MIFLAQGLIGFVGEILSREMVRDKVLMKIFVNNLTVSACQCRLKLWNISLKAEKLCFILLMRFKKDQVFYVATGVYIIYSKGRTAKVFLKFFTIQRLTQIIKWLIMSL